MKCIKTCSNVLQYIKMYCNILQCIKMCCNVLRMTGIKASSWEGWKGSWLASERGLASFQPCWVFYKYLQTLIVCFFGICTQVLQTILINLEKYFFFTDYVKGCDRREVLPHVKCVCHSLLRHCIAWKSLNETDLKSQFLCKAFQKLFQFNVNSSSIVYNLCLKLITKKENDVKADQ